MCSIYYFTDDFIGFARARVHWYTKLRGTLNNSGSVKRGTRIWDKECRRRRMCKWQRRRHSFEDETMRTSDTVSYERVSWEWAHSSMINYCHLETTSLKTCSKTRLRTLARRICNCGNKREKEREGEYRKPTMFWIKIGVMYVVSN